MAEVFNFNTSPRQRLLGGLLERTAFRSDGAIVTFNWFDADYKARAPHSHPFDQLVMILSGRFCMVVDGVEHMLEAGSVIRIPADVPHAGKVVGDERVLNVDVFAPAREDYLFLTAHQSEYADATKPPAAVSDHVGDFRKRDGE